MHRLHLRGGACAIPIATSQLMAAFNGQVYAAAGGADAETPSGLAAEVRSVQVAPESVDGMYACSLADLANESVTLRTDPYFIKPLFYRMEADSAAFCSEFAPLARMRSNSVRMESLAELFAYGWTLSDRTWLTGLSMVGRNNVMLRCDGIHEIAKPARSFPRARHPSLPAIRGALERSIRQCTMGRGPFALAVSGGLDSSILAWELNRAGVEGLVTISVRLPGEDDGIDSLQELNLPRGGAWTTWRHRTVTIAPSGLVEELRRAVLMYGQPTTMSSLPLSQKLADTAQEEGVRVLLSGEGADELFAGYSSYNKVCGGDAPTGYYRNDVRERFIRVLFGDDLWRDTQDEFLRTYRSFTDLRAIELELRLPRLLLRTDITLMSRSIEGRTPFLHAGIPELALAIPWDEARSGGGKWALRSAYSSDLGPRAHTAKARFRLTDAMLQAFLGDERLQRLVRDMFGRLFGAKIGERTLQFLRSDTGFDADVSCLVLSLAFLLEAGVLS
jgi:asparagine synthase (glutamine-hydrolysing)